MKTRKPLIFSILFSLFFSVFAFAFTGTTYAAMEKDVEYTYRYESTQSGTDMITTTESFYMDDIPGGFGELTKTFDYPSSYSVSALLKEDIVLDVVQQIIDFTGIEIDGLNTCLSIEVEGIPRDYETYNFQPSDYPNLDLNSNIGSRVIESEGEYDIKGSYCLSIGELESMVSFRSVRIFFNIDTIHMTPIVDGSLLYLNSYNSSYETTRDDNTLYVLSTEGVFSTDPNSSGYIVSEVTYNGLPSAEGEYEVTFVYENTASIKGTEYISYHNPVKEEPYTIYAILDFKTVDGEWHSLRTNTVTIRHHTLKMRINNIEDYRVAVDKEYEYSFIFDDDEYNDSSFTNYNFIHFDGERVEITEEGKLKYSFDSVGTKTINIDSVTVEYHDVYETVTFYNLNFEVEVLSEEPVIIPPDYHIDFSFPSESAVLFGGSQFEISASINDFYGDERFTTEISVSGNSLGVLESSSNTMTLIPLGVGRSVIQFKASSRTAGDFSDTVFLDVVQSTETNTSIKFVDEINLTGSDVTAYLEIDGYSTFLNATPKWSVKVQDGENLVDVAYETDESGRIILKEAPRGYYHYYVSGDGITNVETLKRVADINIAQVAATTIPYVAPIMVFIIVLVILLRYRYNKRHTLQLRLSKMSNFLDTVLKENNRKFYRMYRRKLIRSIKKCQITAYSRDQETLGQYQAIGGILSKSLRMCQVMKIDAKKRDFKKFLKVLKQYYIDEALRICIELDAALEKHAAQKVVVAVTAPKEDKLDKTKEYQKMVKKFYHQADHEDDNGRSGDDDRNADTKTEG